MMDTTPIDLLKYSQSREDESNKVEGLASRIRADHFELKKKYGLPDQKEKYQNPENYLNKLRQIAKDKEIKIYGPEEYRQRYNKDLVEAYCDDIDGNVYVRDDSNVIKNVSRLEHEMVHAMQIKNGDANNGITIEQMEYEAYVVANLNLENLTKDPTGTIDHIAGWGIKRSCENYYRRKGVEKKQY